MPRNLSTGVYSAPAGTYAAYGTIISPTAFNAFVSDIGTEVTNSIDARGETPMAAPLNMSGQRINNVAAGSASTDAANVGQLVPPGAMMSWPNATPPAGWFIRNGQAISRAANPSLFSLIGTAYGAGDGSTTFNLPDDRDLVLIGAGNLYALGSTGGEATHILTTTEMPQHNHGVTDPTHGHVSPAHTHTDSGHLHTYSYFQISGSGASVNGGAQGSYLSPNSGTGYAAISSNAATINNNSTGITTNNNGSNGAHNNMQPYRAYYPIIRGG